MKFNYVNILNLRGVNILNGFFNCVTTTWFFIEWIFINFVEILMLLWNPDASITLRSWDSSRGHWWPTDHLGLYCHRVFRKVRTIILNTRLTKWAISIATTLIFALNINNSLTSKKNVNVVNFIFNTFYFISLYCWILLLYFPHHLLTVFNSVLLRC